MRIPWPEHRFWNPSAAAWRRTAGALAFVYSTLGTALLPGCVFETEHKGPVILFMGNSITLNLPAPEAGWSGNWGMAASAPDKDYVHQTIALLKAQGMEADGRIADKDFCEPCDGGIDEQAHNMAQVRRLHPRYVIVQLSEHSFDIELRSGKMTRQYQSLLQGLRDEGVPHVYCLGAWNEKSPAAPHGVAIREALSDFPQYRFLDISSVAQDTLNYGDTTVFKNVYVAWHPGDKGMRGLAGIISDAILGDR